MKGSSHRLIDTHCHLDFELFANNLENNLCEWREQGVTAFVVPSVTIASAHRVLALASKYSQIYAALGLHPCFIEHCDHSSLGELEAMIASAGSSVVALGELGLDRRVADFDRQRYFFDAQLEIARARDLPVVVHSVKTHSDVVSSMRVAGVCRGVVHAYSGSLQDAEKFVEQGMFIGVGSVICRSQAHKTRKTIAALPLSSLLLETDSPDMTLPGDKKGQGSPADLPVIFQALCALRAESPGEVGEALRQNSQRLFDRRLA